MDEQSQIIKRLTEKSEKASRYYETIDSDFYSKEIALELAGKLGYLPSNVFLWGGYEEAGRVRFIFSMDEMRDNYDGLALVSCRGNKKFLNATHRDYLGALMSLGIKREKFGDIIVYDDGADIFLDKGILAYILASELSIRRVPMTIKELDLAGWEAPEQAYKSMVVQLASLRLDGIIAKVFNLSRAVSVNLIAKEKVMVNYKLELSSSHVVKMGDVVSVRGHGKFIVDKDEGLSKKGKYKQTVRLFV